MTESVQQIIVNQIIDWLKQGLIPRKQTRITRGQKNFSTKEPYKWFNQLLLSFIAWKRNISTYRLTRKQMTALGWTLKEWAEPTRICFYKRLTLETTHKTRKGEEKNDEVPMLRYYIVYNLSDIEWIEIPEEEKAVEIKADDQKAFDEILLYMKKQDIGQMSGKPCYNITRDCIQMPQIADFDSMWYFLETFFHEVTHSTWATNRLDRKIANNFGNEDYSKEELVAEIGSSILCNEYGVDVDKKNKQAYINWRINALEDKPNMIITAGNKAFKAVEFYFDNIKN